VRIDRVVAEQNCGDGIIAGTGSLVTDSIARRNFGVGISGNFDNLIRNSVADFNQGSGIFPRGTLSRWLVQGSVANGNGVHGIAVATADANLVVNSSATNNVRFGIHVSNNSLVLRSSAIANGQLGISAGSRSGVGFVTANGNATDISGSPVLVACIVAGGSPSCP
jgi:hypothetical protein